MKTKAPFIGNTRLRTQSLQVQANHKVNSTAVQFCWVMVYLYLNKNINNVNSVHGQIASLVGSGTSYSLRLSVCSYNHLTIIYSKFQRKSMREFMKIEGKS